jgi:CheY-like chemotaxis protein
VTPKLLLADDSVTIQRVIELTFADEDVQVLAVGDGRQAIERVQTERPDIVLADVGMPEHDGYEVAAFIKGNPQLAHIPVLLLTGAFEPVDEVRARAVGCDGVLVKPFEPQMVISRVRDLLSGNRNAEPAAPSVAPRHAQGEANAAPADASVGATLEDYFDRLDAALASKAAPVPVPALEPRVPVAVRPAQPEPPRVKPLAPPAPPAAPALRPASPATEHKPIEIARAAAPPPAAAAPAQSVPVTPAPSVPVAPATPPPAAPVRHATADASSREPSLQEAFAALLAAEQSVSANPQAARIDSLPTEVIDDIANRVIARLGDESMRAAVLDAAERLVREEIARIKAQG